eukprot:2816909-Pyramimonas_sp.AAC.1
MCIAANVRRRLCNFVSSLRERIWIDDLSQRVPGSREHVRSTLIRGGIRTAKEFRRLHSGLADKSVISCSRHADAAAV